MKLSFTSKMCLTAIVAIGLVSSMSATGAMAQSSPKPVFHKAPLLPGEFAMLSLGSVKPGGWLKRELQIQADGITGHMDEFYHLLTTNGWLGQEGPKFNSYQWAPYYLDGLVPLAHLLDDKRLKDKAAKWINWTLDNPHKDGWIGPPAEVCNRPWGMWYPTPMLKALVQHFEATGDKRVIPVLTNFFKAYTKRMNPVNGQTLLENSDHEITVTYFEKGGDEGLEVLWDGPEIERQRIPDASLKDLQYEYYEGSWSKLPDFDNLKVVDSGSAKNFDIASIYKKNKKDAKPDNFAIRFSGKIAIRENGWYTFYLISDAGSQLSVKSQLVVDNDGLHPMDRGGLKPEWAFNRWGDVAYVAMWLYDRTSDETLIDLVKAIRDNGRNWSESFTTFEGMENAAKAWGHHQHGVNTAMGVKTPGISYLMTKDKYDLDAITRCFENLDKYHGTPVGIFTAEECLSGRGPDKGCELCLVIDEMFSIELLMSVVGDWRLADRLEKITYNAWPATVGPKQWTHQYFQRVNQVACEKKDSSFIFGPLTHFPCCTTNLPQGWPKFAANTWMATPDGGLVAVVYAPSEVTSIVAGDKEVKIVETTEYPFDENIKFTISTKAPVEFPLYVRIPGWCDAAEITEPDGKTTSGQETKQRRGDTARTAGLLAEDGRGLAQGQGLARLQSQDSAMRRLGDLSDHAVELRASVGPRQPRKFAEVREGRDQGLHLRFDHGAGEVDCQRAPSARMETDQSRRQDAPAKTQATQSRRSAAQEPRAKHRAPGGSDADTLRSSEAENNRVPGSREITPLGLRSTVTRNQMFYQ
jgi:hypothetical protein